MEIPDLASDHFWDSPENHLFLNPRLAKEEAQDLQSLFQQKSGELSGHVFLASSGSTTKSKLIAIAKSAILHAAQSVNQFLKVTAQDSWALSLPTFHVSGLSVHARARLSGIRIHTIPGDWDAKIFVNQCLLQRCTLASLVPTQLFDLVQANLTVPPSLRVLLVGGATLDSSLHTKAKNLGWPVLPCYGMTESAAFFSVATHMNAHSQPIYETLSHVRTRCDAAGNLHIQSPALFTAYLVRNPQSQAEYCNPKDPENFWNTGDQVELLGAQNFLLRGRGQDFVKVLGEKVHLKWLEQSVQKILAPNSSFALLALPEERRGHEILLVLASKSTSAIEENLESLKKLNSELNPFERIQALVHLEEIPRSELGKVQQPKLLELLTRHPQRHPLS